MHHRTILRATGAAFVLISALALLPLVVLVVEFSGLNICDEPLWFFTAKFYGSYFLFPLLGALAALFLLMPFIVVLLILKDFTDVLWYAAMLVVGLLLVSSLLEFLYSPHAIFEIAPRNFATPEGQEVYRRLETLCSKSVYLDNLKYKGFQSDLATLKSMGRSYSSYVYYLAFPAQSALHLVLLSMFFVIIYFRKSYIEQFLMNSQFPWTRNNFFVSFGLALILGGLWCIYRLSYRFDNIAAFGKDNNDFGGDLIAFGLYFMVIVIYMIFAGFDLEKLAKTGSQVAGALALLGFSLAVPTGITGQFFGIKASLGNFIAMVVGLLLLIAVGLIFNTPPPPPPRAIPEPEIDG